MSRALGLAAYRAMSWRLPEDPSPPSGYRGPGQLLWIHAATPERYMALCDLAARVRGQRPGLNLLVTVDGTLPAAVLPVGAPPPAALPSDHPNSVEVFLDHWRPDLCLWVGGGLRPNLISTAANRRIPLLLADLGTGDLPVRSMRWLPDVTRACLNCFDTVLASSEAAAAQVRRLGLSDEQITVTSRLHTGATPPPCSDKMFSTTTEDLGGRPVWLAAPLLGSEAAAVISAHREALKLLHRLLLVIIPTGPEDYVEVTRQLTESGLRHDNWSLGDEIDDNTQVLVSCSPETLGLWYRVAPLTFMASSLPPGAGGRNPLDAAALGSAVLYGPHVDDHRDAYARLSAEGAARIVRDADGLAGAVVRLVAPDEAARMALAGWQVVTESAHLTDMLADLIQDRLDLRETSDAGA